MVSLFHLFVSLLIFCFAKASPFRRALTPYAPVAAVCPSTPLVRNANGISVSESNYICSRYTKAAANLLSWAKTTGSFNVARVPVLALTTSGGGYRSLLEGAGVIQAFDSRDSQTNVSGVFQGLTYQAGLSGGSWLLSSIAGNNYPTITSLRKGLWEQAFQNSLLVPGNLLTATTAYGAISADIASKGAAGYPPTLTDPWGRLLSYELLYGADGGVSDTLSGLTTLSNFTSYNVPYPIITAIGVETWRGECTPGTNGTQYELHPYEFGSWDNGVNAFTQTAYLGTHLSNGKPSNLTCIKNYDNLGYVLGTSSNLFNNVCEPIPPINSTASSYTALLEDLAALVNQVHAVGTREEYAVYPNPFRNYNHSSLVAAQNELSLVDGGETNQNNPIWPLLHRAVDVILVNDNSADANNFPNGSEIYDTYQQAQIQGLTRMPVIPTVDVFLANRYNQRPTFFGCNDNSKTTIIYLPNFNYTYPSNQSTYKLEYTVAETDAMIANGVQIATKGGDKGWPLCLACGIMKKAGGSLPSGCASCFKQYCYN